MALSFKSGTYTGDGGTTKAITGVGFLPKVVIIFATLGTGDAAACLWKTSDMTTGATGGTANFGENGLLTTGQIDSLDSDGFTVRDQKNLNTTVYYYIALAGTDTVTGTYTGNATDNRAITGVGFQPEWMSIGGSSTYHSQHKSIATGASTDISQYGTSLANISNAIQSLDSDGFTIGTANEVNANLLTYYWFAIKQSTSIKSGTYTGNGSDNRDIAGVGFTPEAVLVKHAGTSPMTGRVTAHSGDLSSFVRANTAPAADNIQSFGSDGFQIGTDTRVNTNTESYYYVAIKTQSTLSIATPSGSLALMGCGM